MLQSGQSLLTFEELVALPYLDAVIREVLRVCPPVFALIRTATSDDLIPLGEPIIAKDGRSASSLPVKKGQLFRILMGIHSIQRDRSIFGEDADDFRPERWIEIDKNKADQTFAQLKSLTIWDHLLAFGGGPRGCIGYRFAVLEVKVRSGARDIWARLRT